MLVLHGNITAIVLSLWYIFHHPVVAELFATVPQNPAKARQ